MTIDRRKLIGGVSALGGSIALSALPGGKSALAAVSLKSKQSAALKPIPALPVDLFNPLLMTKFVKPLINPLGDAPIPVLRFGASGTLNLILRQTTQPLGLEQDGAGLPPTTLWGYAYGATSGIQSIANRGSVATFPGPTIEVQRGSSLKVRYVNGFDWVAFPADVPVDTTISWADPGGLGAAAPIPSATHLHGGHVNTLPNGYKSDGGPLGWSTPRETYTGPLFARNYTYDNMQEAGFLWYHDHALGITRTNVYMGLAGLYFLRDANENWLRFKKPGASGPELPSYPYEVPLVIQDRMFRSNGSLYYPSEVADYPNPDPDTPITAPAITHMPEFFGDTILVNARAWPKLEVEPRKYRFRLLNGSDSRFYELAFWTSDNVRLPIWVIGTELGFLNVPTRAFLPEGSPHAGEPDTLLMAPADRYDIVMDFSGLAPDTSVLLLNTATTPYPGGDDPDPSTTQSIMAFTLTKAFNATVPDAIINLTGAGTPTALRNRASGPGYTTPVLQDPATFPVTGKRRKIFLFEGRDTFGRLQTMIGRVGTQGDRNAGTRTFLDPITEKPLINTTEVWEFYNMTGDAHPIHMHLVDFRILSRQPFTATTTARTNSDGAQGAYLDPATIAFTGPARVADPWEAGKKDTVIVYPGEVARVVATFDRLGHYVYHCHILSHEDHEMMRPFQVVSNPLQSI